MIFLPIFTHLKASTKAPPLSRHWLTFWPTVTSTYRRWPSFLWPERALMTSRPSSTWGRVWSPRTEWSVRRPAWRWVMSRPRRRWRLWSICGRSAPSLHPGPKSLNYFIKTFKFFIAKFWVFNHYLFLILKNPQTTALCHSIHVCLLQNVVILINVIDQCVMLTYCKIWNFLLLSKRKK